jgi:vitamin B12 transporter
MRHLLLVLTLFIVPFSNALAQMKTVELEEVVIESMPFEKFVSGSKIEKSDSLEMARLGNRTLADYLAQNSTVYIREQGNAMLASVSFRGTGASHTGVFWHGININSLTLGSTDFNSVPIFLFDQVAVQYGGASSLHGSDAIGGSVHLSSKPQWTDGTHLQLRQDVGSFGHFFTGGKVRIGNGKWESKTSVFNRSLKNNFTYQITDRLGEVYEIEQGNSQAHNYGVLQEVNGKTSKSGQLSLKGWYGSNYHQIQPLMITFPEQAQEGDEILDRNLRLVAEYAHFFSKGVLSTGAGYVWDYQLFNESDVIETQRGFANAQYEWNLGQNSILMAGGTGSYIVPNVWSYESDLSEWRSDVFVSFRQKLLKDWTFNLNARKTFVPFTDTPLAPSFSTSYKIANKYSLMLIRGQVEKSFRVPTFNDRYWGDQGRRDLNSENGYSTELGYNFQLFSESSKLEFDLSAYYMRVEDWIAWKPDGTIWRPYNLKEVESSGVETRMSYTHSFSKVDLELGGMYAFNRAILLRGITENDAAIGYQLPYTPAHRSGLFMNLIYNGFRLSIYNTFTGKRLGIDVINEEVDAFMLTDLHLSKNIILGKQQLAIEGQVRNLFDVHYQNVNRYAMPGRNFLLSVNFFIND